MPGVSMRRERSRPRRRDCHFVGPRPNFIRIHAGNALRPRFDTCVEHPFWCAVKGSRFKVPRVPSGDSKEGSMRRVTALTILAAASVLAVTAAQAVPALAIRSPAGCYVIVSGTNPYSLRFADGGGSCEKTTTTVNNFAGFNFHVDLAISDRAITAAGTGVSAAEGKAFAGQVATFSDVDTNATAADYSATVSWGDGSSSTGTVTGGAGSFSVSGSHSYSEEGSFPVAVAITDSDNASNSATTNSTAAVADAALVAGPACLLTSPRSYDGPTATFVDAASPSGTLSDFSANINWGDGATSTGVVSGPGGGPYSVSGSHTYATTGSFTITTTVTDTGGSVAVTSCRTIGFSFAPGGGSFVIGGPKGSLGSSVTFWGAQWAKLNSEGGMATASFKGFAEDPTTPTCGARWSADPGNSTPPPAGSLPAFMAVMVTSAPARSGSAISGIAVHIVIVQTNGGYSPNPGHAGTGTVVATVC